MCAGARPRFKHGVLEEEVTSIPDLIPKQHSQRATAAKKIMGKHSPKKISVCFEEQRRSTMPRTSHLNPCFTHPHWHSMG